MTERIPEPQEIIKHWNKVSAGAAFGMPATLSGFDKYIENCKELKERLEHQLKIVGKIIEAWNKWDATGGGDYLFISSEFEKDLNHIKEILVEELREELGA